MHFAVVSCSLDPDSRSRLLARRAHERLASRGVPADWLDLVEHPLPLCDGGACYGDPNARFIKERLRAARGILLATPIYNFDASSAAKNLIELTGKDVWADKVAGFLCAAGGQGSYMSIMALANSLMLDFRTLILPRFVYATGRDFADGEIASESIRERIDRLADDLVRLTSALGAEA